MKIPWTGSRPTIRTIPVAPALDTSESVEYVALLLDRSSSMSASDYPPSRLDAGKAAANAFYSAKRGIDLRDQIALFAFDDDCRLISPFGDPRTGALEKAAKLRPGRSTAIGQAIDRAARYLASSAPEPATRRLVLLSDGDTNVGKHPRELLPRLRKASVIVDGVGIGSLDAADYRRGQRVLREVAKATGGTFAHCASVDDLLVSYRLLARKKPVPQEIEV